MPISGFCSYANMYRNVYNEYFHVILLYFTVLVLEEKNLSLMFFFFFKRKAGIKNPRFHSLSGLAFPVCKNKYKYKALGSVAILAGLFPMRSSLFISKDH